MTVGLRTRVAVTAAVAVAVAVLVTSLGLYAATDRSLQARMDERLQTIADELVRGSDGRPLPDRGARVGSFGGAGGFVQVLDRNGERRQSVGGADDSVTIPVSPAAAAVAAPGTPQGQDLLEHVTVDGQRLRVLTRALGRPGALQVALPLSDDIQALRDLRSSLTIGGLVGVLLAAGLGLLASRRALRPVAELTMVAEDVAATGDLGRRIEVQGDDEVARLGSTFNQMLASLGQARSVQEQLVADASHELRTPLTSLRTNIEVLEHADRLDADERRELIHDVVEQLAEFGRLIDGLVELTRGAQPARATTPVILADVVAEAVDRAAAFHRGRTVSVVADDSVVIAERDRLARAVNNLVDNAIKYGADPIEIVVASGVLSVRDHGPGLSEEDLPHVFDRFYRAPEARSAPGSGLGLSIVAQVAESHGGKVSAANAPGGGAVFTLRLPSG